MLAYEECDVRDAHATFTKECGTCGWVPRTDSEKLEFLYQTALKADALMRDIGPQVGPLLESVAKNPMLKMFLR